jgi:S-adenosylmethionine decarboxylase
MTVHTWPEFGYAAVDVFTCSEKMRAGRCISVLAEGFKCLEREVKFIPRGCAKRLVVEKDEL